MEVFFIVLLILLMMTGARRGVSGRLRAARLGHRRRRHRRPGGLADARQCRRILHPGRPLAMADRRRDQFPRRLLGPRPRHADRHSAVRVHGDHAAEIAHRRGPAGHHGAALRPGARRSRHLRGVRRRPARRHHRHRRRDRGRHGADLAAGDAAQQLFASAGHRHHRRLRHARPDHSAVDRADHSGRPARQRHRPGRHRAQTALQGHDRRAHHAVELRRHLDQRRRNVPRRAGARACCWSPSTSFTSLSSRRIRPKSRAGRALRRQVRPALRRPRRAWRWCRRSRSSSSCSARSSWASPR